MKNAEVVDAFVQVLLQAPEHTMQAVAMRLSTSRYEMKLLKADPFLEFDQKEEHIYQLPPQVQMRLEERGLF